MSLTTFNKYGKISISEDVVATITGKTVSECYGVVDLVSRRFSDNFSRLISQNPYAKGVKVVTDNNYIFVDIYVVLKVGVKIEAVKQSISEAVKYNLEKLTGMRVKHITVNVVGIRV